ncbi:DNA polymerase III subunit gamma/tau [Microbacterium amylolyticum]|uniref:DNA polymerase III subunit gamma/tau n=1 Tax=Microbacterium amylolyticum TaxID=936337 RepID=A0ABS4ZKJ9_9MICO|nr:DNA polymerase III subunit gamma/tau [Microbacterium amylolyticum]MBP2437817.1 hypothetical protein [Microbacterium amylolyticum]
MSTSDEDALSWGGDDDPTLAVTSESDADVAVTAAESSADTSEQAVEEVVSDEPEEDVSRGPGNVELVTYGVLGGIYAMWVVGWVLGVNRVRDWILAQPMSSPDAMFQASAILAPAAPVMWFVATLLLTRGGPAWQKILWLGVGVIALIPWPFIPGVTG